MIFRMMFRKCTHVVGDVVLAFCDGFSCLSAQGNVEDVEVLSAARREQRTAPHFGVAKINK